MSGNIFEHKISYILTHSGSCRSVNYPLTEKEKVDELDIEKGILFVYSKEKEKSALVVYSKEKKGILRRLFSKIEKIPLFGKM